MTGLFLVTLSTSPASAVARLLRLCCLCGYLYCYEIDKGIVEVEKYLLKTVRLVAQKTSETA